MPTWSTLPIRAQLAVSYGGSSGLLFCFLAGMTSSEAAQTFNAELDVGIKAFVLPVVFGLIS
eukprot:gene45209-55176_t